MEGDSEAKLSKNMGIHFIIISVLSIPFVYKLEYKCYQNKV
jgi:hypothetical protein